MEVPEIKFDQRATFLYLILQVHFVVFFLSVNNKK